MTRKTVKVTLPEEVDRYFQEAAARERTTKSALMRRTLAGHIARNRQFLRRARRGGGGEGKRATGDVDRRGKEGKGDA